ncbi:MAG TPA: hypothetical protein VJA21_11315 [Verrucomicrobiae bacterium]
MNSTVSRLKKSPSWKARNPRRVTPCASSSRGRVAARRGLTRPTDSRTAFRIWRALLPTPLERDTLLMPDAIAESVVAQASRYLNAELPEDFAERLAAKAHYLYPRHKHFHKMLNRSGNRGRDHLYMYMRHWTASWLKRERYALFKRLPWEYALGKKLP